MAANWLKGVMDCYGGNPYAKLIEMAKKAPGSRSDKRYIAASGETNNGQTDWPDKVKKRYTTT